MDTKITIRITQGACQWGPERIAADEAAARQALYEAAARERLDSAYPYADIVLAVDLHTDASASVDVLGAMLDDGERLISASDRHDVEDRVREILGQAWQDACEASL